MVMVAGEVVMENGRATQFDEREAAAALAEHLERQAHPAERAAIAAELTEHVEAWYQSWDMPESEPYTHYNGR